MSVFEKDSDSDRSDDGSDVDVVQVEVGAVSAASLMASDAESHNLKVPCTGQLTFARCTYLFKFGLWILTGSYQIIPVLWIVLIVQFYSEEPSFHTWLLHPGVGFCAAMEFVFGVVITFLAIVQLLQKCQYPFLHKCRVMFNVILAACISNLIVFALLSIFVQVNMPSRIEQQMTRELNLYRRRGQDLHQLWDQSQTKYHCCGFGGDLDYDQYPQTCCPPSEVNCTTDTKWNRNCFVDEYEAGKYYVVFGTVLLCSSIPYVFLFYMGYRYFRPYWEMERHSHTTLATIPSKMPEDETTEETEDFEE